MESDSEPDIIVVTKQLFRSLDFMKDRNPDHIVVHRGHENPNYFCKMETSVDTNFLRVSLMATDGHYEDERPGVINIMPFVWDNGRTYSPVTSYMLNDPEIMSKLNEFINDHLDDLIPKYAKWSAESLAFRGNE